MLTKGQTFFFNFYYNRKTNHKNFFLNHMIYVTIEPLDHQVIKPAKAKWLTEDKNKKWVQLGC